MTQRERAVWITRRLCEVYPERRPLLDYETAYQLLISVILSAQTTDAAVNLVTPELFNAFPGPADLASAPPAAVERIIHSTGFYRNKAKNIVGAARAVHQRFNERVPESMEELLTIPGVGRKSANVIRGIVYGHPSIVVDTHLARVSNRLELVSTHKPVAIERELRALLPEDYQTDFSMSINLHGRYRCHARKPDCASCEVQSRCPFPQKSGM